MWMWLSIFLPVAATDTCTEGACAHSAALLQSSKAFGRVPPLSLEGDYRRITPCQDSSSFTPDKDDGGLGDIAEKYLKYEKVLLELVKVNDGG